MLGIRKHRGAQVDLHQGDLTRFACDVLVLAADDGLCPVGTAVAAARGALPARWIVRAASPVWKGGRHGEEPMLAAAIRCALDLAEGFGARHVTLPALGVVALGFPLPDAARIACKAVRGFLDQAKAVRRVTFVLTSFEHYDAFRSAVEQAFPEVESAPSAPLRGHIAPGDL